MQLNERSTLRVALAATFVWLAGYLSVWAPVPAPFSPYSLPTVVPELFAAELFQPNIPDSILSALGAVPLALIFVVWSFPRLRIPTKLPLRSMILFTLVATLSLVLLRTSWLDGMQHQGGYHTRLLAVCNGILLLALLCLLFAGLRRPSPVVNLTFHTILFSWVAWSAFPWLGELI
jgi:hypothetical protein